MSLCNSDETTCTDVVTQTNNMFEVILPHTLTTPTKLIIENCTDDNCDIDDGVHLCSIKYNLDNYLDQGGMELIGSGEDSIWIDGTCQSSNPCDCNYYV
eukprot:UN23918